MKSMIRLGKCLSAASVGAGVISGTGGVFFLVEGRRKGDATAFGMGYYLGVIGTVLVTVGELGWQITTRLPISTSS